MPGGRERSLCFSILSSTRAVGASWIHGTSKLTRFGQEFVGWLASSDTAARGGTLTDHPTTDRSYQAPTVDRYDPKVVKKNLTVREAERKVVIFHPVKGSSQLAWPGQHYPSIWSVHLWRKPYRRRGLERHTSHLLLLSIQVGVI